MTWTLQDAYMRLPVGVQNIAMTLYGTKLAARRYGPLFWRELRKVRQREGFTRQQWRAHQIQSLNALLPTLRRVPFYADRNIPDHFTELDQLQHIPVMNRADMQRNGRHDLLCGGKPRLTYAHYTSGGTTGSPVDIYWDRAMNQRYYAHYEQRMRRWAGVSVFDSRAMFGGRAVMRQDIASPPFWRMNWLERQMYVSVYHVSAQNLPHYIEALGKHKPRYLIGYASSLAQFARLCDAQDVRPHTPRAIITGSDTLTEDGRELLERVFEAPVFNTYNGAESACLVTECERHTLHISPDVGIVELLDAQDRPVPTGVSGRAVVTGLINHAQPLVRFDTGDLLSLSKIQTCSCGREMPVVDRIEGRVEAQIVTQDGRIHSAFNRVFADVKGIIKGRAIQHDFHHLEFEIETTSDFTATQRQKLISNARARVGPMDIQVKEVDEVTRAPSGKFEAVQSHIAREVLQNIGRGA